MAADDFTRIAEEQFEQIYRGDDVDFANAIVDACDLVLNEPGEAQAVSGALITDDGRTILAYPVPGYPGVKIFWSSDGPLVEAIFGWP